MTGPRRPRQKVKSNSRSVDKSSQLSLSISAYVRSQRCSQRQAKQSPLCTVMSKTSELVTIGHISWPMSAAAHARAARGPTAASKRFRDSNQVCVPFGGLARPVSFLVRIGKAILAMTSNTISAP